jgi:hypothetical protein
MSAQNTLGYNDFPVPIATVMGYAGQTVPAGWLKCDAKSYLTTEYPDLFSAIGDTFTNAVSGTIDIEPTGQISAANFTTGSTFFVGQTIRFPELFPLPPLTAVILTWDSAANEGTCTLTGVGLLIATPFNTDGFFGVPNLAAYPYIVGTGAGTPIPNFPYQEGGITTATAVTLAANNIPSLSAAKFDVADFSVTPSLPPATPNYAKVVGGTEFLQNEITGDLLFKTDTNTTNGATFSVGGQIAVTNPVAQTDIPVAAEVTIASIGMYYIIKARWAPPPTVQEPQAFEYVENYYLQDQNSPAATTQNAVVWDKLIGGFQYNKDYQNIL